MKGYNQKTGKRGEEMATDYLINKGCKMLVANYRCRCGEIDLVVSQGEFVVFVEVKTRTHNRYGLPREAVTIKKQKVIIKAAQQYIQRYNLYNRKFRFDVIEVYYDKQPAEIVHIENAFSTT